VSEQPKQNLVTSEEDLPEQMRVRREKRARLLASGK
jgi:lysyl-tRNA synthetase class 2